MQSPCSGIDKCCGHTFNPTPLEILGLEGRLSAPLPSPPILGLLLTGWHPTSPCRLPPVDSHLAPSSTPSPAIVHPVPRHLPPIPAVSSPGPSCPPPPPAGEEGDGVHPGSHGGPTLVGPGHRGRGGRGRGRRKHPVWGVPSPNHRLRQVSVDRDTEITLTLTTAQSILESSTKD